MEFEDRVTITTPEGVDIDLPLAGLGSRMAAGIIDLVLQWLVIIALFFALVVPFMVAGQQHRMPLLVGVFAAASFAVHFGYHILFETLSSGRTPAKRWTGLRVVRAGGQPITFRDAAVRNIMRLVDGIATGYVLGIVAVLASPRNQRLGDMAAGTIVVRETRPRAAGGWGEVPEWRPELATWDVTALTEGDVTAVRRFLARRGDLSTEARARLAMDLATRLRPRVAGAPDRLDPEAFLEAVVAAKTARP